MSINSRYLTALIIISILTFAGFVPSFYLRSEFMEESLPLLVIAHGIILTLWFFVAIAQALLIRSRRRALHKTLGWMGAGLAVLIIIVTCYMVARLEALGVHITGGSAPNIGLTFAFFGLVSAGIFYRRRLLFHRRLMLFATLILGLPGINRFAANTVGIFSGMPRTTVEGVASLTCLVLVGVFFYREVKYDRASKNGILLCYGIAVIGIMFGVLFCSTPVWEALVSYV